MKKNIQMMINSNKRKIRFYAIMSVIMFTVAFMSFLMLASELQPEYDTIGLFVLKTLVSATLLVVSGLAGLYCGAKAEEGKDANKRLAKYYNSMK